MKTNVIFCKIRQIRWCFKRFKHECCEPSRTSVWIPEVGKCQQNRIWEQPNSDLGKLLINVDFYLFTFIWKYFSSWGAALCCLWTYIGVRVLCKAELKTPCFYFSFDLANCNLNDEFANKMNPQHIPDVVRKSLFLYSSLHYPRLEGTVIL